MGGVLIGVSDDAKRMQAVPVDSASFETAKEELRAYIVDDKGKELDILNFIGRHGITPDDFKKLLDVVHQELLLKNEQDLLKNEEILKAWDKQEEEKNEKFWKEFFPLYIHDEKCPNCKSAQIKFMRDETHFWYEPCPNCGHVKKMRELKKKSRNMACPKCGTPLVGVEDKRYETLSEHVSNPNKPIHPLRPAWICPKKRCLIHQSGGFYGYEGSYYGYDIRVTKEYWYAKYSQAERVNKRTNKQMSEVGK